MFRLKRTYDPPAKDDGERLLVDRLWPRGLTKERAALDGWLKELAPSDELRRSFCHVPERWEEFEARYRAELSAPDKAALLADLVARAERGTVTLLFSAKDPARNNAVVLKAVLEEMA
jgi:uncharacterized protein YeaO (DUF488 family)